MQTFWRNGLFWLGWWMAGATMAQTRVPTTGNPVQTLPAVVPATPAHPVTVQVTAPPPQAQALLAQSIRPQRFTIEGPSHPAVPQALRAFEAPPGTTMTVGDLVQRAQRCTSAYQQAGYPLSLCYIPQQNFAQGVVRVQIVEGFIARLQVNGNPGPMETKIQALMAPVLRERPLRQATFERALQLAGQLPGLKIQANASAPTTTDGATVLVLDVQRKPFDVKTSLETQHPGTQGIVQGSLNGLSPWGGGEQLTAAVLFPEGANDARYQALGYQQLVGTRGWSIKADASRFQGDADTQNQLPNYLRHTVRQTQGGLTVSYPLILSARRQSILSGGAYATQLTDAYRNTLTQVQLRQTTRVRAVHAEWTASVTEDRQTRQWSLGVTRGTGWGSRADLVLSQPGVGRADLASAVDAQFTRYTLSATQSNQWGAHWGTVVSLTGQYSPQRLPSSEQISFGGTRYGLAYDPGILAGDSGWGASLELNRPVLLHQKALKAWTPYVVVQSARVRLNTPGSYVDHLQTLALGSRLTDNRHYAVDLSVGQPIGALPSSQAQRSPRWAMTFSYQLD